MSNIRSFFSDVPANQPGTYNRDHINADCVSCGLHSKCKNPKVPMSGQGKKGIMVIFETPGHEEARDYFIKLLQKQFDVDIENDCYKVHTVNCRPPNDRKITDKEARCCRPMVEAAIASARPKVILLLGGEALKSFFAGRINRDHAKITSWRRNLIPDKSSGAWVVPLFNPVFLLQNNDKNLDITYEDDLRFALSCVDLDPPVFKEYDDQIKLLKDPAEVEDVLDEMNATAKWIFRDYETSGSKPYHPGHKVYYIGVAAETGLAYSFPYHFPWFKPDALKRIHAKYKTLMENPRIHTASHNLKFETKWEKNILKINTANNSWCTMTNQHMLDVRRHMTKLEYQILIRYGVESYWDDTTKYKKANKKAGEEFNTLHKAPMEKVLRDNAFDTLFCRMLYYDQYKELRRKRNMYYFCTDLIAPGLNAFARMEDRGINVNVKYYEDQNDAYSKSWDAQGKALLDSDDAKSFKKRYGYEIGLDSGPDLRKLFYDIKKYPVTKRTAKSEQPSVDAEILHNLGDTFAKDLLRYRKTKKILDYLEQYVKYHNNGKLHASFNLNQAESGRSNSMDPNLQNVPVRDQEANQIVRGGIIPSSGNRLAELDFGQIEVRIMACYSHDPALIRYIKDKSTDMHRDEICKMLLIDPDRFLKMKETHPKKYKAIRHIGKNDFVFPQFYGDWYVACAESSWEDIDVLTMEDGQPVKEHLHDQGIKNYAAYEKHMRAVEDDFWKTLRVTKEWRDSVVKFYQKYGYVDTFFGFRRAGYLRRNQIVNTPVQGTAFHCLLWSFIQLDRECMKRGWEILVGQIHDSIIGDVSPDVLDDYLKIARRIMEDDLVAEHPWIIVPMEIEAEVTGIDQPWNTKKEYKIAV